MSYGANDPNGLPLGLPSILSLGLPPLVNPYPALNLDFIDNQTLDSRVTFSRGSQATLFDSTGTLRYAANNIVSYSEQFDNAFWSKTDVTVTQNAAIAPDGTLTADKLIVNNGTTGSNLNISPTFQSSTAYTGSIYAKAGEWNWLEIELRSETTSILRAWFDLSNGVVGTVNAGMTATITPVGNGWYRCTATRTTAATNTSTRLRYYSTNANNSNTTGDGTSGIFIWGAMLNIGSTAGAYVQTVASAYYAPRFDYNPSTLQPLGLLIEEARTNLFLQSQFASGWSFSNASFTSTTIAPDGTNTGQVLNDSSAAAAGYVFQGVNVTSGTVYAFSVFAKSVGLTSITLRNFTQAGAVAFNLTGSGSAETPTGTFSSPAITAVGNGWYRCSVIFTATGTASNNIAFVANPIASTGEAFAIWGAQLETGVFATSYIPTTTTALTRNADVASMTGTNFSSWYNASEGTALTDFSFVGLRSVSGQRIITIDDGSSTNLIAQSAGSTNGIITSITDAGSSVMSSNSPATTFSANTQYKILIAYKENDSVAAVNGTVGTADTSNTIPTVTTLRLAASSAASTSNCWFRRIAYYPTRLPDATLQGLTA